MLIVDRISLHDRACSSSHLLRRPKHSGTISAVVDNCLAVREGLRDG